MVTWKKMALRLRLLRDTHIGTGAGRGDIDDLVVRDHTGTPLIPQTVIQGRLAELCLEFKDRERLVGGLCGAELAGTLFGWGKGRTADAGSRGSLKVGSAYAAGAITTLRHTATALEHGVGKRIAKQDTRRTLEYVSAGAEFEAACWLRVTADKGSLQNECARLRKAIDELVRAWSVVGGQGSRGDGWLVTRTTWSEPKRKSFEHHVEPTSRVRLLLRAAEPLLLSSSAEGGNVVESFDHIRGSQLQGALINAMRDTASADSANLTAGDGAYASRNWSWLEPLLREPVVSPAYPLPLGAEGYWKTACVRPAPLSHRRGKQTASSEAKGLWAETASTSGGELLSAVTTDQLGATEHTAGRRLDDSAYVFRTEPSKSWRVFSAPRAVKQRIRRPSAVRDFTEAPSADRSAEPDLFTVHEIPSGTYFVCDLDLISLHKTGLGRELLEALTSGVPLWVGHGGRPVQVLGVCDAPPLPYGDTASQASDDLRISLLSDLIVRDGSLANDQALGRHTLMTLLKCYAQSPPSDGDLDSTLRVLTYRAASDTLFVGGRNASSGRPRPLEVAIRRGSVLQVKGSSTNLQKLSQWLQAQPAWGERTAEGYGRLCVDHGPLEDAHETPCADASQPDNTGAPPPTPEEVDAHKGHQLFCDHKEKLLKIGKARLQAVVSISKRLGEWTSHEGELNSVLTPPPLKKGESNENDRISLVPLPSQGAVRAMARWALAAIDEKAREAVSTVAGQGTPQAPDE